MLTWCTFSDYHHFPEWDRLGTWNLLIPGGHVDDNTINGDDSTCGIFLTDYFQDAGGVYLGTRLSKIPQIFALTKDYHDNSGDGGSSFWPDYGRRWSNMSGGGMFCDNDHPKTEVSPAFCSRLSKNQVLLTI